MTRPWRIRFPGAKYHVTSRGNGRARIFLCEADYRRFLDQLSAALDEDRVVLYAYCLMPNHFHLHLQTPRGNLPRFMQRLNTAYSMYFRHQKKRPGHCFEGRYGAKLVEGDDYLLRLTRYIHLNPVNTAAWSQATPDVRREALENYRWSSYRSYAGLSGTEEMVDYRWLKLMGRAKLSANRRAYRRYIDGFVGREDEVLGEAMVASRYAIGEERFREQMDEAVLGVRQHKADDGDIHWPEPEKIPVEVIVAVVAERFGVQKGDLRLHGRRLGMVKAVAIEMCCRLSGLTQRELSGHFGYRSESSVGRQRKTLALRLAADPSLRRKVDDLAKRLANRKL